jgi:hypothetical protein
MNDHEHRAEQDDPVEDGHADASDRDRLDGVVEQTKQDVAMGHVDDPESALRERLADVGIEVDEQEFATLLESVRG